MGRIRFGTHRVPGRELSEFLSVYYLWVKNELTEFVAELTEFAAELSEFSLPKQYPKNLLRLFFALKTSFCFCQVIFEDRSKYPLKQK